MFSELHELARRASLHLMLAAEGDKLRVTLQPKPTGNHKGDIPPALVLVGEPAELDRDFVVAISTYAAPVSSILDQAQAQAKAIAEKPEKKPSPAKAAVSTKPAAAKKAVKRAAKPATAPAKKAPFKPKGAQAGKSPATREELLGMMREFLDTLAGKKPSRAAFIKKHPAGRRYERLFPGAKGFAEFVAAASQQDLPMVSPEVAASSTPPIEQPNQEQTADPVDPPPAPEPELSTDDVESQPAAPAADDSLNII